MIWVATAPSSFAGEALQINALMHAGLDVLLLRKPDFSALEYERLLGEIDPVFYSRIMIAGQPELVLQHGLMGLHMSEAFRASADLEDYHGWELSTSVHGVFVEVRGVSSFQYQILGPVFNSISKPGYMGCLEEMKNIPPNALAIGGITEKNIGLLPDAGFCGAVLLGAIWNDPFNAVHTYQSIKAAWNRT